MCKTNCKCAPEVPDLADAIRASRRAETVEQRVARLTGAFKVAIAPIGEAPRVASTSAGAPPPPDLAAALAART